jgi:hypothetical protein
MITVSFVEHEPKPHRKNETPVSIVYTCESCGWRQESTCFYLSRHDNGERKVSCYATHNVADVHAHSCESRP